MAVTAEELLRFSNNNPTWRSRLVGNIEYVQVEELLHSPYNNSIHPWPQQNAMRAVLRLFGWCEPIVVNRRTGHILNGKMRAELAAREGDEVVPVAYIDVSPVEERLLILVMNAIAKMTIFDRDKVDEELAVFGNNKRTKGFVALLEKLEVLPIVGTKMRTRYQQRKLPLEKQDCVKYQTAGGEYELWQIGEGESEVRLFGRADDCEEVIAQLGKPATKLM